jgi:ABC-type sugar transport system ATPase subunit
MVSIALEQVTKRYPGDVLAVAAVDLAIADGELMVLVGPRAAANPPSFA